MSFCVNEREREEEEHRSRVSSSLFLRRSSHKDDLDGVSRINLVICSGILCFEDYHS